MVSAYLTRGKREGGKKTHRKEHVYEPARQRHVAPKVPRFASAILVAIQLPTAELLVQPPAVGAVAHLDIREPLRDYRDDRSVDSDAGA